MTRTAIFITGPARSGKNTASDEIARAISQKTQAKSQFKELAFAASLKLVTRDLIKLFYNTDLSLERLDELKCTNSPTYWIETPGTAWISASFFGVMLCLTVLCAKTLVGGITMAFIQAVLFIATMFFVGPQANVRTLLQQIGTEVMRKNVSDTIWSDATYLRAQEFLTMTRDLAAEHEILESSQTVVVTFTDARFDNEPITVATRLRKEFPDLQIVILRIVKPVVSTSAVVHQRSLIENLIAYLLRGTGIGGANAHLDDVHLDAKQATHASEAGLSADILERMPEGSREIKIANDGSLEDFKYLINRMVENLDSAKVDETPDTLGADLSAKLEILVAERANQDEIPSNQDETDTEAAEGSSDNDE